MLGAPDCRPEPFYFWFYFVFMNILWIIFPGLILVTSGKAIYVALCQTYPSETGKSVKTNTARVLRSTPSRKKVE